MNTNIQKIISLNKEKQDIFIYDLIKLIENEISRQDKNDFTEYLLEREEIK